MTSVVYTLHFLFVAFMSLSAFGMEETAPKLEKKWTISKTLSHPLSGEFRIALFDRTGDMIFLGGTLNLAVLMSRDGEWSIALPTFQDQCEEGPSSHKTRKTFRSIINQAAFNPQADELAVVCDKEVRFFDFAGEITRVYHQDQGVIDCAYNDDATRFVTAMLDGRIVVWNIDNGDLTEIKTLSPLYHVEFLPSSIMPTKKESLLLLGGDHLMAGSGDDARKRDVMIEDEYFPYRIQHAWYDSCHNKIMTIMHGAHKHYPRPSRIRMYDGELGLEGKNRLDTKIVTINRLKHEMLFIHEAKQAEKWRKVTIGKLDWQLLSYKCKSDRAPKVFSAIAGPADDQLLLVLENGEVQLWEFKEELPEELGA